MKVTTTTAIEFEGVCVNLGDFREVLNGFDDSKLLRFHVTPMGDYPARAWVEVL